jgi:hypothetical protein
MTHFMRRAALALVFITTLFVAWELRPWMRTGGSVPLGSWKFGDFEFEAWQRNTDCIFEPFATGLFMRQGTNQWQAFCLDFQDCYSPKIALHKDGDQIVVLRRGKRIGVFDLVDQKFTKPPFKDPFTPGGIGDASRPPGKWWLKN